MDEKRIVRISIDSILEEIQSRKAQEAGIMINFVSLNGRGIEANRRYFEVLRQRLESFGLNYRVSSARANNENCYEIILDEVELVEKY